eukprot:1661861-Rhodomonas_salina.1
MGRKQRPLTKRRRGTYLCTRTGTPGYPVGIPVPCVHVMVPGYQGTPVPCTGYPGRNRSPAGIPDANLIPFLITLRLATKQSH